MSRKRIIASDDSAVILLPQEVLDQMGISNGDEIEMSIEEGAVILRPLEEAARAQKLAVATDAVIERRKSAYERLAEGVE
jgi:antitoxin component of MazEF toxin-antitoxin module